MIKGDNFPKAMVFSILWHAFCFSFIGIVFLPKIADPQKFSEVSFLGPILEKTAFEMMVDSGRKHTNTLYRISLDLKDDDILNEDAPNRIITGREIINIPFPTQKIKKEELKNEYNNFEENIFENEDVYYDINSLLEFNIEGDAFKRKVLHLPDMPVFEKDMFEEDILILKYSFIVDPFGNVTKIKPIYFGNYPNIDQKLNNFLKECRFLSSDKEDKGLITFNLKKER